MYLTYAAPFAFGEYRLKFFAPSSFPFPPVHAAAAASNFQTDRYPCLFWPNGSPNKNPYTYVWFLGVLIAAYVIYFVAALAKKVYRDKTVLDQLRYRAPLFSALFLLLAGYDYLTLSSRRIKKVLVHIGDTCHRCNRDCKP